MNFNNMLMDIGKALLSERMGHVHNIGQPIPRIVDRVTVGVPEGHESIYADIVVHRPLSEERRVVATIRLSTEEFTPDNVELISALVRHANDHAQYLIRKFMDIFNPVVTHEDNPLKSV